MSERAAIVTGGSSGIGLAIARVLVQEGHRVTLVARRADRLGAAAASLAAEGGEVEPLAANLADDDAPARVVAAHRARFGRLDVLVNNAGVGVGAPVAEIQERRLDLQLDVNLRSLILMYRECAPLLRAAAAEHRNALVVNSSSISGKHGERWLSVYSATKAGVIAFTQAMNAELGREGIKSCALCPAWVDTPMTDFIKGAVPAAEMIRPEDVAEAVRMLLALSPSCLVGEIAFEPPGGIGGGLPSGSAGGP
ncbi:MAG TPA: SDR family oxidoreductase [Solirubrobacteraceae bacterium]|nr:SDR family oxidoreductase [Solirubrobacteraceae bacterium]